MCIYLCGNIFSPKLLEFNKNSFYPSAEDLYAKQGASLEMINKQFFLITK